MSEDAQLTQLIEYFGIQRTYYSATGESVRSSDESVHAVLRALGADTSDMTAAIQLTHESRFTRMIPPVLVAWEGRLNTPPMRLPAASKNQPIEYQVRLENGEVLTGEIISRDAPVATLPPGYHELEIRTGNAAGAAFVIAAPRRCFGGKHERMWGVFAPLYALRESADQPVGTFSDLAGAMAWVEELGGDVCATLPLNAAFLSDPFDPSPYAPASRLFWNELYLDVPLERTVTVREAANRNPLDYRATAQSKRAQLERMAADFFKSRKHTSSAFRAFEKLYPDAKDYAAFRAAGEKFQSGWPVWPDKARAGHLTPRDYDAQALHYHWYAQFVAHTELSALAQANNRVELYLDLALGVHPDSYDVWRNRDLFVMNTSAGAPPDPFLDDGQNWGFPPPHPINMREQRYAYWRKALQTQLRYGGFLRIDHVMSLHRLYFVPHGFSAKDGVYVKYPAEELYAVLALESTRHEAVVVGEDLGTVPDEVRESMARHDVKRLYVVQFELTGDNDNPLRPVPANAVASLNTHDMPPFETFWRSTGARPAIARAMGDEQMESPSALSELLKHLAASPAQVVLINLEDLWLESEPQNVPGTGQERPNWRRRLKYTLAEIRADKEVRNLLRLVDTTRAAEHTET